MGAISGPTTQASQLACRASFRGVNFSLNMSFEALLVVCFGRWQSEGIPTGSPPGCCGGYVGSCRFETSLLGQQARMHVGQEALQLFQVAAVFERFFFNLGSRFGMWRQVPQTFPRTLKLASQDRKVVRPDGRTVVSFRTKTNQRGTQIVIHLPQGFERVGRRHPWKSMRARPDAGSAAL